ncbi:MAG: DNA polymerase III subunit delta' [Desulfuromonadales bacterium]|nr:DNA polymerase III subunit delta' [Desulfuromonadales bacterium]
MPFSDIISHRKNISILTRIAESNRLAHAYLFWGPEGTGKKKTAIALIESVFCESGGCGVCPSCRKIKDNNHPDIHIVAPEGQFIKIDQIRALQKALAYRPYEAKRKACIIDDADKLNLAAGNALLKTLEEPPGDALIILVATNIENILPTIRSRCQTMLFGPVPAEDIEHFLITEGISEETAHISAMQAGGSIGKALEIAGEETLNIKKLLINSVFDLSTEDLTKIFSLSEEFDKDRGKAILAIDLLITLWRDMIITGNGSEAVINQDMVKELSYEFTKRGNVKISEQIDILEETRNKIIRNANVRLAIDRLFMKLAA